MHDGMVVGPVEPGVQVRPQCEDVEPKVLGPLQQRVGAELLVEFLGLGVGRHAQAEPLERVANVGGQGREHHRHLGGAVLGAGLAVYRDGLGGDQGAIGQLAELCQVLAERRR